MPGNFGQPQRPPHFMEPFRNQPPQGPQDREPFYMGGESHTKLEEGLQSSLSILSLFSITSGSRPMWDATSFVTRGKCMCVYIVASEYTKHHFANFIVLYIYLTPVFHHCDLNNP